MQTLREWIVSIIGNPEVHRIIENPNYSSGYGNRYQVINVQYDWAFIASALAFIVCLWGFITLIRMLFQRFRR